MSFSSIDRNNPRLRVDDFNFSMRILEALSKMTGGYGIDIEVTNGYPTISLNRRARKIFVRESSTQQCELTGYTTGPFGTPNSAFRGYLINENGQRYGQEINIYAHSIPDEGAEDLSKCSPIFLVNGRNHPLITFRRVFLKRRNVEDTRIVTGYFINDYLQRMCIDGE